ncbi:hypothetical protein BDF14DRAFT_368372 [Spinellus fusiger]|nr:hypothetical protein BDF14DRAFT_368372 [Spinellus fusiger]
MEKQLREKTEEIEELSQKLKQAHDYDEEQVDEHVLQLEKDLSEKEDLIAEMKERLQQMDSQNADFHTYENQFDILNEVLKRKDACLQEMEEELSTTLLESQEAKARYDNDLKTLNIEFRGMLQKTQEREVRITTLEDDNEAQRDAFERERVIYADEIRDLAAKLKSAYHSIKQKDSALAELEAHEEIAQQLESYQARLAEYKKQLIETEELYQARVKELLDRLKEAEELVKQERRSAMETIRNKEKTHAYQREEIEQLKQRNSILLSLSSQQSSPELKASKQDGSRSSEQNKVMLKAQLMGKLNDELKKDLEERERELESSREMGQTLETSLNATTREYELLKRRFEATTKMLTRRNHQITRSMERFESASVRNETMGSILFQQAIEGFDTALLGNELENTE